MLLGAVTAALGVVAVVGVERIDLPPAQVRAIAAALPVAVLIIGVVLLGVGTIMARLALREAEHGASSLGRPTGTPALGAGQHQQAEKRPAPKDRVV